MIFAHATVTMARIQVCLALGLTLMSAMWGAAEADGVQPSPSKPVVDTPIGRRVFNELAAYYATRDAENGGSNSIPYAEMLKRLSSKDPARRMEAGEYLYALCLQTESDDRLGRAPRPHGMRLGGGPNEYGAELRESMARELSVASFHGNGEEAFDVARWLYLHDRWPDHRNAGAFALTRIRTREADKLFARMIEKPEGHFGILTIALIEAAERKLAEPTDQIRLLCRHYNSSVREAALSAASRLGLKNIASYRRRTDLGPRIEQWLRAVLNALPDKVPANVRWRRFAIPADWTEHWITGAEQEYVEICGWLVGKDDNEYRVIDWRGEPQTWNRKEVRLRPDSLSDFAARVAKIRKKFDATEDNDEKHTLQAAMGVHTSMMSSHAKWGGSIPEVLAAAWSLDRGDRETCAQLMIPLMAHVLDEEAFLNHFRDEIAVEIDKRMLTAFTAWNYDESLRLAKILARPWFDGFPHQGRAKGLAATLPHRSEDFKKLTLISPKAWADLKNKYSRRKQIEYLGRRLRLIHARQWSNPGGIEYADTQYQVKARDKGQKTRAEPTAIPDLKEAINPYSELLRLNLTGDEMLALMPELESTDYILAYDLYRFIPQGPDQVHKVSWVAASIFNTVSQQDLVDFAVLEGQSPVARKHQLEKIRKWCADHAALSHADHLAKTVNDGKEWQDVQMAFWGLFELDEERAVKLIVFRCDQEPARQRDLAKLLCLLGRRDYLSRANEWMKAKDEETRFWGALSVLKGSGGKNPEGLDIVLAQLAKEIEGNGEIGPGDSGPTAADLLDAAVETLVAIDNPRVQAFFSTYCGARPRGEFDPSSDTLQRLVLAGYDSAYDRVLYNLSDNTPEYGEIRSEHWLWWVSFWRYKNPPAYLYDLPEQKREEAYADLKRWLSTQFRLIRDGKPSNFIKQDLDLPWGDWASYSTGWVRRL